ncbi:hypothetical protein LJR251_000286 [Rhizobium rhizogenes]|uniref:hypothetical protein n=1 Tax=Rhizobium rhizogenes TaxID=359 RepID=UPI003ECC7C7B
MNTLEYGVRALTESDLDSMIEEFGSDKIADILDSTFVRVGSEFQFKEQAADAITSLLIGNSSALLKAVVAAGTDKPREVVDRMNVVSLTIFLVRIAKVTFAGSSPEDVAQMLVDRMILSAGATSAVMSENLSRH